MSATEASIDETDLNIEDDTDEELDEWSPAHLFLEDFVVTNLLSAGRGLRAGELAARAEGFTFSRSALREALKNSPRLVLEGREWETLWRAKRRGLSREERSRQPVESMIQELLLAVGKPLPVSVIAREVSLMRHEYSPQMKSTVTNVLRTARFALEIAPDIWMHSNFELATGAPTDDVVIRANRLQDDPDFQGLIEFAEVSQTTPAAIAIELMEFTGGPLTQKVIGFFVRRANPAAFSARAVAAALNDRTKFAPLLDGFVALKEHLPDLRASVQGLVDHIGGGRTPEIDLNALLRTRVAANEVLAPTEQMIEEVRRLAKATDGAPVSLATVVLDVLEMEANDPTLVPTLQGLNDALRKHPDFMPAGIGRFILRANIPSYLGEIPASLRPVSLEVLDPETKEPYDFEMTDEGLEGDSSDFVHSAEWEDVAEEIEVRLPRRLPDASSEAHYVLLNHHLRSGTLKLRRMDEDFFELNSGIARLPLQWKENGEHLTAWANRETGLIYGLGEWLAPKVPESGAILHFRKDVTGFWLELDGVDPLTLITPERAEELLPLRESAAYLSLYELLRRVLADNREGTELAGLWAEVNFVRRTSKRLMCSVLSGYHGFYFKQRGPKQLLWRFDVEKAEGFKRNKRKFVRK